MSEEQREESPRGHLSARLPESVGMGVFATAVSVMGSPQELVLDFLQTLVQPAQVVARVILPWTTVPRIATALKKNLENYDRRFGEPELKSEPDSVPAEKADDDSADRTQHGELQLKQADGGAGAAKKKSIETRKVDRTSFYDDLKFDDNILRGSYANGAMINHTEHEFKIDFLLHLTPYPVVTSRVFLTEIQMRRLLKSMEDNLSRRG